VVAQRARALLGLLLLVDLLGRPLVLQVVVHAHLAVRYGGTPHAVVAGAVGQTGLQLLADLRRRALRPHRFRTNPSVLCFDDQAHVVRSTRKALSDRTMIFGWSSIPSCTLM
jgi:hypothetical protein